MNIVTTTIPAEWLAVYRKIRDGGFPDAILGGGCLRDLVTGRADRVKDLDIFVGHQPDMVEKLKGLGYHVSTLITEAATEYLGAFDRVHSVYDLSALVSFAILDRSFAFSLRTSRPENNIQVIATTAPMSVRETLSRFDLGICQIAYTDRAGLQYTSDFLADLTSEGFRVTRCESRAQFERTYARWRRLEEKYKGWGLSVPDYIVAAGYASSTRYPVPHV